MNDGAFRRFRMVAAGAATLLLVSLGLPQLAQPANAAASAPAPPRRRPPRPPAPRQRRGRPAPTRPARPPPPVPRAAPRSAPPRWPGRYRGSASATVVWCPPTTGASQVTSYTVTASPGRPAGHRRRAERLGDHRRAHRRHRLHVHGHRQHEGRQRHAGRRPRARPRRSRSPRRRTYCKTAPQTVSYDQYSMLIGGKRVYVTAGEFDPWRTPSPSLWLDDLQKMKADGYNAVTVYFDWDYNSARSRRVRLRRRAGLQRVPQHGAGSRAVRHRPPGPVHQRGDRRRRHPVLGPHRAKRLPHRHPAVPVRRAAVAVADRPDHRRAPGHQGRRRHRLPGRERVRRLRARPPTSTWPTSSSRPRPTASTCRSRSTSAAARRPTPPGSAR